MTARDVLSKLDNVKSVGNGWSARCPTHDDKQNSLSINEGNDGRLLLNCFAGCPFEDVLKAISNPSTNSNGARRIRAVYDFTDEHGLLLYQSVRYDPKDFRQRKPDGQGGYIWNLRDVRQVPFRLPALIKAREQGALVALGEGEEDALTLERLGYTASSFKRWQSDFGEYVRGLDVVLFQDHDKAGVKQTNEAAQMLSIYARSVKIVDCFASEVLPDKHGKDVSDFIEAGGRVEQLEALIAAAPLWKSEPQAQGGDVPAVRAVCMADVTHEEVAWLLPSFIPRKKVTILTGEEGSGKTWLTCGIAAAVSRGLNISHVGEFAQGRVLMLTTEDGLGDTMRPRLDDCGADLSRIFACDKVFTLNNTGMQMLEALIIKHKPVLVTIDPFYGYVGANANINQDNVLRSFMAPLKALAERYDCSIVLVRHFNKAKGHGDARSAGLGGIGLRASARTELFVGKNPDDENDRALIVDKSNLAPRGAAVGYTILDGQFAWKPATKLTVRRILASDVDEDERLERAEAVAVLRDLLTDVALHADEAKREMKGAGFSDYATRKAQRELHIKPRKAGGKFGGKGAIWWWQLPPQDVDHDAQGVESKEFQLLVANSGNKSSYSNGLAQDVASRSFQRLVERAPTSCVVPDWLGEDDDEILERAAIMEFDGGLDREEAERLAGMWEFYKAEVTQE